MMRQQLVWMLFQRLAVAVFVFLSCSTHAFAPTPRTHLGATPSSSLRVLPESTILLSDLGDIGSTYAYCLDHYYLPTQSATAGVCTSIGDVVAQVRDKKKSYDPTRTLNYFVKGLGGGIMWAYWFQIADTWSVDVTRNVLEKTGLQVEEQAFVAVERATRTAICVLLEQFLVCPLFYTFWDIPLPALLRGSPMRQIPAQVQSKLGPLLVANAKVWTPVNLVTYNIPLEFRVLFASCADIVWQSINAGITSQEINVPPATVQMASNTKARIGMSRATDVSLTTPVEEAAN
jgi:hypothetical protein